jgi:hypothetical protein
MDPRSDYEKNQFETQQALRVKMEKAARDAAERQRKAREKSEAASKVEQKLSEEAEKEEMQAQRGLEHMTLDDIPNEVNRLNALNLIGAFDSLYSHFAHAKDNVNEMRKGQGVMGRLAGGEAALLGPDDMAITKSNFLAHIENGTDLVGQLLLDVLRIVVSSLLLPLRL